MASCEALTTPNTLWNFCPNLPASYVFTILFALTTILHIAQVIIHKKPYCWVIVVSGTAQTIAYIFRDLSIKAPANYGEYAAWFVLILVAPLFTNAFVYMVMGRMMWNYVSTAKIYGVNALRAGLYFVILDVFALVVQIYGAAEAATGNNKPDSEVLNDLHIYMIGVGIQQGFILLFVVLAVKFHRTLLKQQRDNKDNTNYQGALTLLYVLYITLALITTRIIFRLIEYSQGLSSDIPNHEVYQYCLDSLPMLLALVLLNLVHPGRIMLGKENDFPSRKERKQLGIRTKGDWERVRNVQPAVAIGLTDV